MHSILHNCTNALPNAYSRYSATKSPHRQHYARHDPTDRYSSISRYAKVPERQPDPASRNNAIALNSHIPSQRSLALRYEKENRESQAQIESEGRIAFKGVQPKRKRNPSKLCDPELTSRVNLVEHRTGSPSLLNGYLKVPATLSLANFQLLKKLGEGAFSQVFLALQRATGALFALKVMEKAGLREQGVVERLASELKIQQFCSHINIVKLYGVFHDPARVYLIQEYAGGNTLFSLMEQRKVAPREAASILRQLCSAVRCLHANSVIHRDIKPENVLVAPGGVVKLTDFGWSVYAPRNGLRDTLCGTPLYLSPEIISSRKYDRTVDLWAIGVLTYELFTGQMPFGIRSMRDLRKILTEDIDLRAVADPLARSFIATLLVKDVGMRKHISEICEHEFLREDANE